MVLQEFRSLFRLQSPQRFDGLQADERACGPAHIALGQAKQSGNATVSLAEADFIDGQGKQDRVQKMQEIGQQVSAFRRAAHGQKANHAVLRVARPLRQALGHPALDRRRIHAAEQAHGFRGFTSRAGAQGVPQGCRDFVSHGMREIGQALHLFAISGAVEIAGPDSRPWCAARVAALLRVPRWRGLRAARFPEIPARVFRGRSAGANFARIPASGFRPHRANRAPAGSREIRGARPLPAPGARTRR